MKLDLDRVRANAASAATEDLLDRVTVYRAGMAPEALGIIEEELLRRGVGPGEWVDHGDRRGVTPCDKEGLPLRCAWCGKPAVARAWRWQRLWGVLPLFPRRVGLCAEHARA
jgi:hypothetical protein